MMTSLRYFLFCWLIALGLAASASAQAQPMRYIYPPPESGSDVRMAYYWDMLQAALDETSTKWGPYLLQSSSKVMNAGRAELSLATSTDITVMARTTSVSREQSLRPIRIPLDKGLTGYRLFLIKAGTQPKLDGVRTLAQLQAFNIGQGATWVDADILRTQGFAVVTGPTYEALLPMLEASRFDLFSRGVNEIAQELVAGSTTYQDLAIENRLLLYYPLPRYFFFSNTPDGDRLAQRVEEGLRLMIKNGKFEKRYLAHKKSVLGELNLAGRRVFRISNPYLPPETPLTERELWDNLEAELRKRP